MDVAAEAKSRPLSTLSTFSHIPARREGPKEMTYFNTEAKEQEDDSTYQRGFQQDEGYDMRLKRDDRRHQKGRGLDIHGEELSRAVPLLSSSAYGRRPAGHNLYQPGRQHSRVAHIKSEFFMKNGIVWNVAEGYGSVGPT